MYSPAAEQLRRCTATTHAGRPCRAWALWNGPHQLCSTHAGHSPGSTGSQSGHHANYHPCRCNAYPFAHRPGSGTCTWPHTTQPNLPSPFPGRSGRSGSRTGAHAEPLGRAGEAGEGEPREDPGRWREDGVWDEGPDLVAATVPAAPTRRRRLAFGSVRNR